MFSDLIESAKRRFYAKPEAIEALKKRDRPALVSALAQPDHEAEYGQLADEMLTIEAQRDQHRARAQQLPQVKRELSAAEQARNEAGQAELARRAEFDRADIAAQETILALSRRIGKLTISQRWLLQNIDPGTQSTLDGLQAKRQAMADAVEFQTEAERQARGGLRGCERQLESAERDLAKHPRDAAHIAERDRWQAAVERATQTADAQLRTLTGKREELAEVTSQIDSILADVKAGKR